ncbi:MAG: hypothetical protein F4X32_07855 [Candidatus Dadabacteria bacterium]|nr:hypothetical protein [Candidatus Dadabacteria bacterium]MYB27393.1 hypothetical protein [Candidatus Dadabacteria bacterium]
MKSQERNYIADIERYFLGLAGKGLMLSARDYSLIRELGERSISKEVVIKAIAYGFEQKRQRGAQEPRGLFNIRLEIEDYLRTHSVERESKQATPRNAAFTRSSIIEQVLKRLDRIIVEEKREDIRGKYEELRRRVGETDGAGSANIYKQFDLLWQDFMGDVFSGLSAERQKQITDAALSRIPAKAKLYDEDAKRKTLNAFRDGIVCETLGINNVFTMK